MTAKQYTDSTKNNIDEQVKKLDKKIERTDLLYNFGTVFTGSMGIFTLFGNPWFGIPLLIGTAAMVMERKTVLDGLKRNKNRLEGEKNHIDKMVKNGLDISRNTNARRKAKINVLGKKRQQAETAYHSANAKRYFADAAVAGTVAVAGFFGMPLLAILPAVALGIKFFTDKNYSEKHTELVNTSLHMNDLTHEYNTSVYAIRSRNARRAQQQQQQRAASQTQSRVNAPKRVATQQQRVTSTKNAQGPNMQGYDPRAVSAVEAYIAKMEKQAKQAEQAQKTKGVQKKKI